MTRDELLAALDLLKDPTAAKYQNTVITDTYYPMRYIRMPALRKLAKTAANEDWRGLVCQEDFETFEEVLTVGLAVAYAGAPFEDKLSVLRKLLPKVDSWAMTDSIVPTLKIQEAEREAAWRFAMECLSGDLEYTVRFGIILLLNYFLTPEDIPQVAQVLCQIQDRRYYVQTGIAWCLAEMAVSDFEQVKNILGSGILDTDIHNMTIRKLRESYRISPEQKIAVAVLKRKG